MAGTIQMQDDFIIGGSANSLITPNFRLKEFTKPDGTIFIHRELISGLQILRERLGAPISVDPLTSSALDNPELLGVGTLVTSNKLEPMFKLANGLTKQGYFGVCRKIDDALYLEIPNPQHLPAIAAKHAFDCGVRVTAAYETSGDPYLQVTGNFDGAGLSFGPIQCNLGTGTLQELFRRMRGEDERLLQRCFGNDEDYHTFWRILNGSRKKAVQWADQLSTGSRKQGFSQPWKGYLQAVGREPKFRTITLAYAYDKYGKLLMSALAFLYGVAPIKISNLRCLAALYDMGVQQGSLSKAHTAIRKRVDAEQPEDEFALTKIAVEERAKKANKRWRADCLSRRLSILERRPVSVTMNGQRARRSNSRSYLLRNSKVKGLDRYLVG
jgi:hypothetical protein